jgi:branched-chain amino acid transport system permease protein
MLFLQVLVDGLLMGGVYVLMALGLSLIFGVLRIINFAHGNLAVIGMYASYCLFSFFGIDPYLSLLGTALIAFCLGYLVQRVILNPIVNAPEEMAVLVTLGLGLIIQNLLLIIFGPDYYTVNTAYRLEAIPLGLLRIDIPKLLAFLSSLVIATFFFLFMERTDLGRAIRASANNREAALLMGVNVKRIYCVAFAIGTVMVAVAGSSISTFVPTSQDAGILFTMTSFVIVISGGVGSHLGPLAGGFLVGILEEIGAVLLSGSTKQMMSLGLLVIILLFRPQGLFGREN